MTEVFQTRVFRGAVSITAVLVLIGGVFYFGYQEGTKNPQTVIIQGVTGIEEGKPEAVDFKIFWDSWIMIKEKYVAAGEVKDQDLVYGAVSGLLDSLKDPNSAFFPPSDAKKFTEDITGEFSGIGAEIGIRNDQLTIIAPLKGTPAEKAGLKAADKILKIDGTDSSAMPVEAAVKLIRGKKGTAVILTIFRNGWDKQREISIIRDVIQVPTLDWEMREGNIAYVHLYNFYEKAPFLFYKAAVEIVLQNPKGMILDLRDNPGGYLEASVDLAGWFLEKGKTVVVEKFRSGQEEVFESRGNGVFKDFPMVILINEGSASASEILAGALRDHRGVKLVGKKSFGKGSVQEVENLKDGSMLKITVARWFTPKGILIEKNGLTPDYEVELTEEDAKAEKDPQLGKAIEVLKSEILNPKS